MGFFCFLFYFNKASQKLALVEMVYNEGHNKSLCEWSDMKFVAPGKIMSVNVHVSYRMINLQG